MATGIRALLRGGKGGPGGVVQHTVGNALVLHAKDEISSEAQSLALSVVEDTENDVVVLDLGPGLPIGSWESMAGVLPRRRRGIRLVACGQHRNAAAMAGQWLSERLNRTVIAPDGDLIRGSAGALFVHSTPGSGWVRFRPGKPPTWDAKRYPTPLWDKAATEKRASSSTGEIEPLPGGVWIHDVRETETVTEHRERLIADVPCQPETMTVLLGCPGTAPLSLDDVVRFWRDLDDDSRSRARFVQYGDLRLPEGESFGQTLADLLATNIVCYSGVPVGSPNKFEIRTVRPDGVLGWPPFALELGYSPRAHPNSKARRPSVLSHRPPLRWTEEIAPRVYWYAPDAVVEVVQAGLWVRAAEEPVNAERVRGAALDPEGSTLIFDDTIDTQSGRMRELAEDLAARLDQLAGAGSALLPASVLVPGMKRPGRAEAYVDAHVDAIAPVTAVPAMTVAEFTPPVASPAAMVVAEISVPVEPVAAPIEAPVQTPIQAPIQTPIQVPVRAQAEVPVAAPSQAPVAEPVEIPVAEPIHAELIQAEPIQAEPIQAEPVQAEPVQAEPVQVPVAEPIQAQVVEPVVEPVQVAVPLPPREPEPETAKLQVLEPEPVEGDVRVQPVPASGASALLPGRPLDEERAWLRRMLSREFDTMASSVSRIMSEHPGMQGGALSAADVLADSVAVRLYLSRRGQGIDAGLRSGKNGPHVPFARCAVSGLSRLPSFRGTTVYRATPTAAEWDVYAGRKLVTDWSFVSMLTAPCAGQEGSTDVLIWSMTARRTALLEPEGDERIEDRVLFLPGTNFKVLECRPPSGAERGAILLREIGSNEIDDGGRVDPDRVSLDELAVASLRRSVERWTGAETRQRIGAASAGRFGVLPGLERKG